MFRNFQWQLIIISEEKKLPLVKQCQFWLQAHSQILGETQPSFATTPIPEHQENWQASSSERNWKFGPDLRGEVNYRRNSEALFAPFFQRLVSNTVQCWKYKNLNFFTVWFVIKKLHTPGFAQQSIATWKKTTNLHRGYPCIDVETTGKFQICHKPVALLPALGHRLMTQKLQKHHKTGLLLF